MEQLARIEARLESLSELGELVGALRSMAASRVREAQEALDGTRAFRGIVERAITEIAPLASAPEPTGAGGARVLVLVASQNGFVGGFNERLVDEVLSVRDPNETLIVVGRRGETALSGRDIAPDRVFSMTSRAAGVTRLARQIAAQLSDVDTARIVHARHAGGADYAPTIRQVLPLAPDVAVPVGPPPLHHLPPDRLLAALSSEYLFAEVAHALMDSLASENAARLRTMDAASSNIDDRLDKLHRAEHVARQEEMTSDMIDIVTGAEAIFNG